MALTPGMRRRAMALRRREAMNVNGVLSLANLIVAALLLSAFFVTGLAVHPHMDRLTVLLGLALCAQTATALRIERRRSDPFVLILAYVLTLFYALRIVTLALYPAQDVLLRFPYGPADSNYALLFILVANGFLYLGLHSSRAIRASATHAIATSQYLPSRPRFLFVLFASSLVFSLFLQGVVPMRLKASVDLIYGNFLTPNLVLLVLATYVVTYAGRLPRIYLLGVAGAALTLAILQTLAFSRGGFLTLVEQALIVLLAVMSGFQIRKRYVYAGLVLLPLLIMVVLSIYTTSSVSRRDRGDRGVTLAERLELMRESRATIGDEDKNPYVAQALERAGYFDFSAELIAHRDAYADVFTLENYLKSIVDNQLTPGFDIFDMPRISASLKFVYGNLGVFSRRGEQEGGHSDQFGIYGELYALFGYAACLAFFLLGYGVKKMYVGLRARTPHGLALKRVFILLIFFRLLNSFGIDWVLWDVMALSLMFFAMSKMIGSGRHVGVDPGMSFSNARAVAR